MCVFGGGGGYFIFPVTDFPIFHYIDKIAPWLSYLFFSLWWRHNGSDSVSNHQPHDCLLNHLFRRRSQKASKLRVTGLCAGNSPGTGEVRAQMTSNAENVLIWWRHHVIINFLCIEIGPVGYNAIVCCVLEGTHTPLMKMSFWASLGPWNLILI